MIRSIVVLPEPEGPSRAKNSACSTARSSARTASTRPKRLATARASRTGLTAPGPAGRGRSPSARSAAPRRSGRLDLGPDPLPLLRRGRRVELVEAVDRAGLVEEQGLDVALRDQLAHVDRGRPADLDRDRDHALLGEAEVDPLVRELELLAVGHARGDRPGVDPAEPALLGPQHVAHVEVGLAVELVEMDPAVDPRPLGRGPDDAGAQ